MEIEVRRADLTADCDLLLGLMSRHLSSDCDRRRFDWLYRDNPAGLAQAWVAARRGGGEAIGMGAVFPRRLYFAGQQETGWLLGDFCLETKARSLGPALQLQRACLAGIKSRKTPIAYDLPSRSMGAIYQRMGMPVTGQMVRFARLLRCDEKVAGVLGSGTMSHLASAGSNWLLGICNRKHGTGSGLELVREDGPCGAEFGELARQVKDSYGACTVRSSQYLNWRYNSHPYRQYEMISARYQGELRGYGVFHVNGKQAVIADLLAANEPVLEFLIQGIANLLQARGICTLSCPALAPGRLARTLAHNGFRKRESTPVMLCEPRRAEAGNTNGHGSGWFLMEGDRES